MTTVSSFRDKYAVEFQFVDMRWGVRDETTDDHMTTSICLQAHFYCLSPYQTNSDRIALFYGVNENLVIVRKPWFQMIGRRKPSLNKAIGLLYKPLNKIYEVYIM